MSAAQKHEEEVRADLAMTCAQVCDYYATALDYGSRPYTHSRECKQAAAAIRARGHP